MPDGKSTVFANTAVNPTSGKGLARQGWEPEDVGYRMTIEMQRN